MKAYVKLLVVLTALAAFAPPLCYAQWERDSMPVGLRGDHTPPAVCFINQDTGVVYVDFGILPGYDGGIGSTFDGGKTWRYSVIKPNEWPVSYTCTFLSLSKRGRGGYVGKGRLWVTTDYGASWNRDESALPEALRSQGDTVRVTWTSLQFNGDYGVIAGSMFNNSQLAVICYSHDGGETWHQASIDDSLVTEILAPLDLISDGHAWVGTPANGLYASSDSGRTWSKRSFFSGDEYLEFINESHGWSVGYRIQKTTDGGRTWSEVYNPHGSQECSTAYFVDTLRGWIATAWNIIATTDGGRSWELQLYREYGSFLAGINDTVLYAFGPGKDWWRTRNGGWSDSTTSSILDQRVEPDCAQVDVSYDAHNKALHVNSVANPCVVTIVSLDGRILNTQSLDPPSGLTSVPIETLRPGLYIASIVSDGCRGSTLFTILY